MDGERGGTCCVCMGPRSVSGHGDPQPCWEPLCEVPANSLTQEALMCSRLSFQATGGRMLPRAMHQPVPSPVLPACPSAPDRVFPGKRHQS